MKKNLLVQLLAALSVILLIGAIGSYCYQKYKKYQLKKRLKKRFVKARGGELSAKELLLENGYDFEKEQKSAQLKMWVNGEPFLYLVRPDAFVIKEGKRYLVEVKTGETATNPKHIPTRRQLLEYYHGFNVDGILLVDAELQQIHDIFFESHKVEKTIVEKWIPTSKKKLFIAFILGALLASALALILMDNI